MPDVALLTTGAQVSMVTSFDESYPPENVIDGSSDTFWTSTGLFPQELIISFRAEASLKSVRISCYNVKKLAIHTSTDGEPVKFTKVVETELEIVDNHLQTEEFQLKGVEASHLRLVIVSSYDHFVSVHSVAVEGELK